MTGDDRYSRRIELHEETWDPTYANALPGIFDARVCRRCGALIDDDATDVHDRWHAATATSIDTDVIAHAAELMAAATNHFVQPVYAGEGLQALIDAGWHIHPPASPTTTGDR